VTVWSSADLTVTGSLDFALSVIGSSKSAAAITIGRAVIQLGMLVVGVDFELELVQDVAA